MNDLRTDVTEIRTNVQTILKEVTAHGVHLDTAKGDIGLLKVQMSRALLPINVASYIVKICAGLGVISGVCYGAIKGVLTIMALLAVH